MLKMETSDFVSFFSGIYGFYLFVSSIDTAVKGTPRMCLMK